VGRISPNALSLVGFLLSLLAASQVGLGHLLWGGLLVLLAGFVDLLDGAVARLGGKVTPFGAVLDSALDRLSEAAVLLGLVVHFWGSLTVYLIYAVLVGSFLVSYIRARGEGLGLVMETGLFTRGERVVVMALGLVFPVVLWPALALIALLSWFTMGERLFAVWRKTARS
jgi:CDP-diacylglycerol--glycerol-3-phosphate 3-phosphatidyltransferase